MNKRYRVLGLTIAVVMFLIGMHEFAIGISSGIVLSHGDIYRNDET